MFPTFLRLAVQCGLILLLATGFAGAQQSAPENKFANAGQQRDNDVVVAAQTAMATGRAPGLAPHVAALEVVLHHAPQDFRKVVQTATQIDYRAENVSDFVSYAAWRTARSKARGEPTPNIIWLPDTYPTAGFLLGWYYNEIKQPERALPLLYKALALAPMEARLVTEKGQALIHQRRFDVALALYDRTLSADDYLADRSRALLLRAKGFCLTELNRLADAEIAYRDALVLEPDHNGAKNELRYIARLKAGGMPTAPQMTTYDKAKQGEYKEQPPR